MQFQIYKLFNNQWFPVDIENVRKEDIIKVKDLDNKKIVNNSENTEISIVTKSAWYDKKNKNWNIQSVPYKLKDVDKEGIKNE